MDKQQAVKVIDKVFHDAACILPSERWEELIDALEFVMPESCFLKDRSIIVIE